jgi:emfourin
MRVLLQQEGGFAGLIRPPLVVDSVQLAVEQQRELDQLMVACDFFHLSSDGPTPPQGAADYMSYTLTVERDEQSHSLHVTDPVTDAALAALIAFVKRYHQ